jgi:hypothetical protein
VASVIDIVNDLHLGKLIGSIIAYDLDNKKIATKIAEDEFFQ